MSANASIQELSADIARALPHHPNLGERVSAYLNDIVDNTFTRLQDQRTFVITGDIPAMWLRDSSAQVKPLLLLAGRDAKLRDDIKGIIRFQVQALLRDPYANAFNRDANNKGHQDDKTKMSAWVWERKYELDSACYAITLAHQYFCATQDASVFDRALLQALNTVLAVWRLEQHHELQSNYRFERILDKWAHTEAWKLPYETLPRGGLGSETCYTGLTWSGFRPSDDACRYGYNIPGNMFALATLARIRLINDEHYRDSALHSELTALETTIRDGIKHHGIMTLDSTSVFAYEVDGFGQTLFMDDANVPSLLSAPYLGFCQNDDPVYLNTREKILSAHNPFYFSNDHYRGIGSPHTPENCVWPIALAMQGLTSTTLEESEQMLHTLLQAHPEQSFMHESFDIDNPSRFTRPWFSWANALFVELAIHCAQVRQSDVSKLNITATFNSEHLY